MKKRAPILGLVSLLVLTACNEIPPQAYFNRGDPENLLDLSSEVVNMSLSSPSSLSELSDMVSEDPPARAELNCSSKSSLCGEARAILSQNGIATEFGSGNSDVTLIYERIVARDCENRYIDNSINPYNLNHPTFGCSVTGNTVQMVSDRRQFVNPNLLDFQDSEKGIQGQKTYMKPEPLLKGTSSVKSAVSGGQ